VCGGAEVLGVCQGVRWQGGQAGFGGEGVSLQWQCEL
jgi:hypothetical protein